MDSKIWIRLIIDSEKCIDWKCSPSVQGWPVLFILHKWIFSTKLSSSSWEAPLQTICTLAPRQCMFCLFNMDAPCDVKFLMDLAQAIHFRNLLGRHYYSYICFVAVVVVSHLYHAPAVGDSCKQLLSCLFGLAILPFTILNKKIMSILYRIYNPRTWLWIHAYINVF